jgi:hypothetical protein
MAAAVVMTGAPKYTASITEADRMAKHVVVARVHGGRLEPIEKLPLPEGSEVTVTVDLPTAETAAPVAGRPKLSVWNLGAPQPLSRQDFYDAAG